MKKILFFVIAVICLLFLSCQKSQPPEAKKEVQVQKEKEEITPPSVESKTLDQKRKDVKESISQKPKKEEKEIPLAKKPSPLTEEEQREFERFGGGWVTPNVFKTEKEAVRILRILVKGNEKTIRWYQVTRLTSSGDEQEEQKTRKIVYSEDLATALSAVNTRTNKEAFDLAVQVLKTKRDYPEALSRAALVVKFAHDSGVIPILREIANYPVPSVRLQVAGSLLSLGDADTALPVLDELAEKEGYTGALYYLFSVPGKIIDERGYRIVERALNNQKKEVKISAIKLLWESKKITKGKAEDIAMTILNNLKDKTEKDYGIGREKVPNKTYYREYVLPEYEGRELKELKKHYHSDGRACATTMWMLGELRSQKAIPLLEVIKEDHKDVSWVCWENRADRPAETALEKILHGGNQK